MKYLNIGHYVKVLLKEGTRWEFEKILNGGINLSEKKIRCLSWYKRSALLIPAIFLCYLLDSGLNGDCIGYAISALSIFIGLFASLIITMYDRYLQLPKLDGTETDAVRVDSIKVKNFIKQFTFVTGKDLLIATTIIGLMSLSIVFKIHMAQNVDNYHFVRSWNHFSYKSVLLFCDLSFVIIVRVSILYLILDFFLLLLYSLGALFSFLKKDYE